MYKSNVSLDGGVWYIFTHVCTYVRSLEDQSCVYNNIKNYIRKYVRMWNSAHNLTDPKSKVYTPTIATV